MGHSLRPQSEEPDRHDGEHESPDRLDWVGAISGRRVNEIVAVMDLVERPHRRPHVHRAMRQLSNGKVEDHDADERLRPHRPVQPSEGTDPQPHSGECGNGRQEPVRDGRLCRQPEVGGSARMLFHGFVMNIGTPVSIRAPAAITERMTPALVKRFRNEIGLPIPQPS